MRNRNALHARVAAAGVMLRTARIGDVDFSYAEGPDLQGLFLK